MENGSPGNFPYSVNVRSPAKQKFVIYPFVDEETNGSYPFANGLKKLNGLAPASMVTKYTGFRVLCINCGWAFIPSSRLLPLQLRKNTHEQYLTLK